MGISQHLNFLINFDASLTKIMVNRGLSSFFIKIINSILTKFSF